MLAGALAACLTLEACLRVDARGWSSAAFERWEDRRPWEAIRRTGPDGEPRPVPGGHASWRIQPWHQPIEYRLDRHGFRTAHASGADASAPCRILALGDSHTFGYGVAADQAWPAVLETMLAHTTVANGGLPGSAVAATEAWLPEALAEEAPRVVVLAVTPWSLREDPEPPEQHPIDPQWPRLERWVVRLTRVSAVADRATRVVLQESATLVGWPPPAPVLWELAPLVESHARFHARWREMDARIARMVHVARSRGATPLVVFVPLDVQVSVARNVLYRTGRLPYLTHGFVDRDYSRDDRYVHALAKTAARLHVDALDATPMLRRLAPLGYLPDDYHLAPDGHAYLAALLAAPVAQACSQTPWIVEASAPSVVPGARPARPAPRTGA